MTWCFQPLPSLSDEVVYTEKKSGWTPPEITTVAGRAFHMHRAEVSDYLLCFSWRSSCFASLSVPEDFGILRGGLQGKR